VRAAIRILIEGMRNTAFITLHLELPQIGKSLYICPASLRKPIHFSDEETKFAYITHYLLFIYNCLFFTNALLYHICTTKLQISNFQYILHFASKVTSQKQNFSTVVIRQDYNGFSLLFIEADLIIDSSTKIFFACLHQKRGYVSLIFPHFQRHVIVL
jgi:hypothetical protein